MIEFEVQGHPKPKGSMRPIGRNRMVESVKGSKDWRRHCQLAAQRAQMGHPPGMFPLAGEVAVTLKFYFPRPKTVPAGRGPCTSDTGDVDKLARNVLDALTDGILWEDDGRVVSLSAYKFYVAEGSVPGAVIQVSTLARVSESSSPADIA